MDDYLLETDALAVGLTRPPLFMGVSMRLFFGNLIVALMICIDLHTWVGAPLFILAHGVMMQLTRKDVHFFSVWSHFLTKTPPVLNSRFWGKVNSYAPW